MQLGRTMPRQRPPRHCASKLHAPVSFISQVRTPPAFTNCQPVSQSPQSPLGLQERQRSPFLALEQHTVRPEAIEQLLTEVGTDGQLSKSDLESLLSQGRQPGAARKQAAGRPR